MGEGLTRGLAGAEGNGHHHLRFSPSRQAITSSSPRTASSTVMTGRASNTKAGSIEQNLGMFTGSSHSTSICPPHSPTRITKNSILKLAGAFHWPNTSRIRFWAFSYSIGEPCPRSNQLITYFIEILLTALVLDTIAVRRPDYA